MRIAIFGAGGVGGFFGAILARGGVETIFIARGEHLRAIRERGLTIKTAHGEILLPNAQATDNPTEVGTVDVILVAVKTWQVAEAAAAMRPMIRPETVIIPLQNGVEASEQLAQILGAQSVLGGLCGTVSWIVAPGVIRSLSETNFIKFGELDNRRSKRVERLQTVFENAGIKAEIPTDINAALWEKFVFSTAYGGIGAIVRAPAGVIRGVSETRAMIENCMREIVAVGQARKVNLADSVVEKSMAFLDSLAFEATTSLQRDIIAGKPSEIDAKTGAAVRLGRAANVAVPINEFIYHTLLPSEKKARGELQFEV